MISRTTERFRKAFAGLPEDVKQQAREAYKLFERDPHYPGLHFKQVHPAKPVYSVRIGLSYRAMGILDQDTIIWFWIGSHSDYDKLISQI